MEVERNRTEMQMMHVTSELWRPRGVFVAVRGQSQGKFMHSCPIQGITDSTWQVTNEPMERRSTRMSIDHAGRGDSE